MASCLDCGGGGVELSQRDTLRSEPVPPERKNMKIAQIAPAHGERAPAA